MNLLPTTLVYADEMSEALDGVGALSKTISNYGPLVVLLSIFFIIFLALVFLVLKGNNKMMKQIMDRQKSNDDLEDDIVNKLVETVLDSLYKKTDNDLSKTIQDSLEPLENAIQSLQIKKDTKNDYHKDIVGAYIDVNMAFKDASREALSELKCSRIAIYMFHNGNVSMLGLPFFKMSCIHEWSSRGNKNATIRGINHIDMPLHLFNDFIEDLWNHGVYKSEDVEKTSLTDSSIKDFVYGSVTRSLYMVAIKGSEGTIAGFVVAEFDNTDNFEHNETRNNEVKAVLDKMIDKISPIVSNKYVYKKKM